MERACWNTQIVCANAGHMWEEYLATGERTPVTTSITGQNDPVKVC